MKQYILIFAIAFGLAFAGGYVIYEAIGPSQDAAPAPTEQAKDESSNTAQQPAVTTENEEAAIFTKLNCLACHAVSSLELKGGATGPDLSQAYINVEGKHGVPLNEFLKQPTSAVMSSVIGSNPLSDADRAELIEVLKLASEK